MNKQANNCYMKKYIKIIIQQMNISFSTELIFLTTFTKSVVITDNKYAIQSC